MYGKSEKTQQHLQGVKCVVNSCYYHKPGDYCQAAEIEIQPPHAQNTTETDCSTYIQE
ncbi:DUF1540 domain-containing protein [Eubacteriales bacterium mix99]|nr:DUF1540 domain-containing protein [Clostridiales bacterium]